MTRHRVTLSVLLASALIAGGAPLLADQHEKAKGTGGPPGMEEMMAAWMKYANPGEHHKHLEPIIGTWEAKSKMRMAPGAPPTESAGTSVNKWMLGGRFVQQKFEGNFMDQNFTGLGYTGYDNYKKAYIGTWMDSMGTMMMSSTGACDGDGKVMIFFSKYDDPMSGETKKVKSVLRIIDNNNHSYEMYDTTPEGQEFKSLDIHYKRK